MASAGKAGWVDIKYIKPGMVASKRGRDKGKSIPAHRALTNKLRYEQYRNGRVESDDLSPAGRHAEYLDTHRTTQQWIDHGLGHSVAQIAANAEKFSSPHMLARSWIFSPDPALLAFVPEAERAAFMENCIDTLITEHHEAFCQASTIEYSYIVHDKPDSLGRDRLHAHITLPGTIYDDVQGSRVEYPFIGKQDLQQLQDLANLTVEQRLDLDLGREWRMQIPEYASNYPDLATPFPFPEDSDDLEVWFPRATSPIKATITAPEIVLDATLDVASQTPAQPETLVDSTEPVWVLLADDIPENSRQSLSDDIAPDGWKDMVATKAPEFDALFPQGYEAFRAQLEQARWPEWFKQVLTSSQDLTWHLNPEKDLACALFARWDEQQQAGAIYGYLAWENRAEDTFSSAMQPIFQINLFDDCQSGGEPRDVAESGQFAQRELTVKLDDYEEILADSFDQAITQMYEDWFVGPAILPTNSTPDFFPELSRELLPFDGDQQCIGLERLPEIEWVSSPNVDAEYGLSIWRDGDPFTLFALKRWTDETGLQHVISEEVTGLEGSLQEQADALRILIDRAQKDVAAEMLHMQHFWLQDYREAGDVFLSDGPPNPFPSLNSQLAIDDLSPAEEDELDEDSLDEYDVFDDE